MLIRLQTLWHRLLAKQLKLEPKTELGAGESADFIIERLVQYQPSWGNSRIVCRIRHWDEQSKRYTFEGDEFWLQNIYSKLKYQFGIENPKEVPIVDLEE